MRMRRSGPPGPGLRPHTEVTAKRDRSPDRLHHPKRPGAGQKALGARQHAPKRERQKEPPMAVLERIHQHHERDRGRAESGKHGLRG